MKIIEKIKDKQSDIHGSRQPVIAFLGDSVTQGCFDVYVQAGEIKTIVKTNEGYHEKVKRILNILYPEVPINIVNAGISGDCAAKGMKRLDRDVLSYSPDLIVVSYGLNDASGEQGGLGEYIESLRYIFGRSKESGAEVIFLTPNLRTDVRDGSTGEAMIDDIWEKVAENERAGWLKAYLDEARNLCNELSVGVCDCNKLWQTFKDNAVDINMLLSNKINHPTEEMYWMFAYELVRMMFLN